MRLAGSPRHANRGLDRPYPERVRVDLRWWEAFNDLLLPSAPGGPLTPARHPALCSKMIFRVAEPIAWRAASQRVRRL